MKLLLVLLTTTGALASQIIPLTFDARLHWAQCPSIIVVQDQGCCAASYAIAATAVMSDRTCILSGNGTSLQARQYSAYDVLNCCSTCSIHPCPDRITDGEAVWRYWIQVGIASEDCLPYSYESSCLQRQICPLLCQPGKGGLVAHDKVKGRSMYSVFPTVHSIQMEILAYGPVLSTIEMYRDFLEYEGGVYNQSQGHQYISQQSVRIVGWGTEKNLDYWLCVNSFGTQWGLQGTFKILRGSDLLGVESSVWAGLP